MDKMTLLYIIAAMNGAALLAIIAGTIELFKFGRRRK